jgi:hypothetical protein
MSVSPLHAGKENKSLTIKYFPEPLPVLSLEHACPSEFPIFVNPGPPSFSHSKAVSDHSSLFDQFEDNSEFDSPSQQDLVLKSRSVILQGERVSIPVRYVDPAPCLEHLNSGSRVGSSAKLEGEICKGLSDNIV